MAVYICFAIFYLRQVFTRCIHASCRCCIHVHMQADRPTDMETHRHGGVHADMHACIHTSRSINSSRLVSRLQRRTYGRCSEPCSIGAERKVGGKVRPRQLWRKEANDLDMSYKSVALCCNGIEFDQFCLMRSAHTAGIHVCVCEVS